MHLHSLDLMMKQKEMLSDSLRALRFYTGDVRNENMSDPFYSDAKAYVTLNSLLFKGMDTELARVEEGRKLNPAFLLQLHETLRIMKSLIHCMEVADKEEIVYRVERLKDYTCFKREGLFTSFISCSDAGFLENYEDKFDLVLMEVHIHKGVKCVRVEDKLEDYLKKKEKEVLIAPFSEIKCKELPLKKEYTAIKDGKGHQPAVFVKVDVFPMKKKIADAEYPSDEDIEKAVRVYTCLNEKLKLKQEDIRAYERVKNFICSSMYAIL